MALKSPNQIGSILDCMDCHIVRESTTCHYSDKTTADFQLFYGGAHLKGGGGGAD